MLIYTSTLLHYRGKYYYFYSNSFTWQLKLWVMCHIHILHKTNHMISLWSLDPLSHPRPDNELLMGLITFKLLRHKHNIDISQSSTTFQKTAVSFFQNAVVFCDTVCFPVGVKCRIFLETFCGFWNVVLFCEKQTVYEMFFVLCEKLCFVQNVNWKLLFFGGGNVVFCENIDWNICSIIDFLTSMALNKATELRLCINASELMIWWRKR